MTRFSLTTIISFFVLASFGQIKVRNDSFQINTPDIKVTLLGTGTPQPSMERFGPSILVQAGSESLLFDAGRGCLQDDKVPEECRMLLIREIREGVIYEKNDVKVIAFEVDHYPVVPAFGYRIEYNGHSVVISGDTRYSENLIKFAKGTDLLIHEVVIAPDTLSKSDPDYHIFAHHTTIEQASKIFNKVNPRLAAYSHIVKLHGLNEQDLLKRTTANYSGRFIIGEDLMSISIGDTVSVRTWQKN